MTNLLDHETNASSAPSFLDPRSLDKMPLPVVLSAAENPEDVPSQVLGSKASWKALGIHTLTPPPGKGGLYEPYVETQPRARRLGGQGGLFPWSPGYCSFNILKDTVTISFIFVKALLILQQPEAIANFEG